VQSSEDRLNKYLALQLGISRREADDLIADGHVKVDGEVAQLGSRVSSDSKVMVRDKAITSHRKLETILFHKPVGYVSSRKAQGDNPTIYTLIPKEYHHLKPVGRLDKDSSGLLLLSNDGNFSHQMTHPSFRKTKIYEVKLDKPLQPLHQQMISDHGIILEDGKSQFLISRMDGDSMYEVTMTEGRNRQIRRTFAALGYQIVTLHRTRFGQYNIDNIESGHYKSTEAF